MTHSAAVIEAALRFKVSPDVIEICAWCEQTAPPLHPGCPNHPELLVIEEYFAIPRLARQKSFAFRWREIRTKHPHPVGAGLRVTVFPNLVRAKAHARWACRLERVEMVDREIQPVPFQALDVVSDVAEPHFTLLLPQQTRVNGEACVFWPAHVAFTARLSPLSSDSQ